VHSRFASIVEGPLQKDPRFSKALDEAFLALVNANVLVPNATKSAQLLAHYCDFLLNKRSSANIEDAEMEKLLSDMVRSHS